ncbi:glycosyltransferase family 4 protein [Geomonas anaerohicana]|uniref:Glycosyltransferase family 4 protein n=1 Tax=Geomonas anaerohicana TaxID=2798583 RepID=A0ABS0YBN0_9BACT|nr:glycosyltransferase family 4 protein [Geomonas anaerohicana]MBJ6749692.1 glycosyltransferase family 4 protein [Geomonas anaerohicana]
MQHILHIVLNEYTNDNRVRRAAECGRDTGSDVTIFALASPVLSGRTNERGIVVSRFALTTRSWPKHKLVQLVKYVEVLIRMTFAGARLRPSIVHAHDVDALPIGCFVAALSGSKLVYDAHELWADPAHARVMPKWISKGLAYTEHLFARRADACITVSESIATYMATHQRIPHPVVVRNVPEAWPEQRQLKLRTSLSIPQDKVIILYQGAIGGDGIGTLVDAFRKLSGDPILVFLGNGPLVEHLRNSLADLGQRVRFHPFVSSQELPSFTSDADIGVHPMAAGFLNHLWALPNKLFEYIQGGLAVVVSDLPEMARVVSDHNIGLTFKPGDASALALALQTLVDDAVLRNRYRESARSAAKVLNWSKERERLEAMYGMLKGKKPIACTSNDTE